jgi:membrane dipeptidase
MPGKSTSRGPSSCALKAANRATGSRAARLHAEALIGDFTLPYSDIGDPLLKREVLPRFQAAGVDFVSLSVGADGPEAGIVPTLRLIARERRRIGAEPKRYCLVEKADDIVRARNEGRLAVMLHFQGSGALEGDLDLVDAYYRLGVRHMLLAYNSANAAADGCLEPRDGGLTAFGRRLLAEMNRVGMLIDCSHTGRRSTLEIMDASGQPVIFSHSNVAALHPHPRNVTDEQIRRCAATGGVVGINGVSAMLNAEKDASIARYLEHVDYIVQIVGPDHVGISLDYVYDGEAVFRWAVAQNGGPLPPSTGFTADMPMVQPEQFPAITAGLLERGYSSRDVRKIVGLNWLRVARAVWK